MIRSPLRLALICAVGVLSLASCGEPESLPPVVVPPAAPPPPPVAMTPSTIESAAAYRAYIRKAGDIAPAFADGAAVEQQLAAGAAYEPKQLLKGQIAYGALVALQSPTFVAEVRTYAVDPSGRRDLAAKLLRDPNYAQALPSAAGAAGMVAATLAADALRVRQAGERIKQAAYDVQKQKWAMGPVPQPLDRLAQAKQVSTQALVGPREDVTRLGTLVQGGDAARAAEFGMVAEPLGAPYTAVVSRSLALAALAALGEATDDAAMQSLMEEQAGAFCLNLSKLNLYQCLSVARPYYEDVFCLGQHVLMDTGQCLTRSAVVTASEVPKAFQISTEPPKPAAKPPARKTAPARKPPAKKTATSAALGPPVGAAASVKLKP
jgi:hypothetical protein